MKWYEYRPIISKWTKYYGSSYNTAENIIKSNLYKTWLTISAKNFPHLYHSMDHELRGEEWWIQNGRPYYDLYPGIAEAFVKIDLSKISVSHLTPPFRTILIRCAEGNSLNLCTIIFTTDVVEDKLQFTVGYDTPYTYSKYLKAQDGVNTGIPMRGIGGFKALLTEPIMKKGETVSTIQGKDQPDLGSEVEKILKIFTTLCLLRNNPDIIEQVPLNNDIAKFERATDFEERARLLEKAKRRGKFAWVIGKHIQTAAGFRHPHFAVRWMGHGEHKTPVVRPIKGCIVNRKKITNVPTGYLDDLEAEVPCMETEEVS